MPTAASMTVKAPEKVCFNSKCRKAVEQTRNGWRCRSGEFAELCEPCASAYVEGRFCETFHSNLPGWRCCETCRKQIHCGCIVSFHMFVLLDAGGIECLLCTRKSFILQPNPAWPQPSLCLPSHPEGMKDFPAKNWSSITGSGPVPWLQAPNLFNGSSITSQRQATASSEIDLLGSNNIRLADKPSACPFGVEKNDNSVERLSSGSRTGWSCGRDKGTPAVNEIDNANNTVATTGTSPTMPTSFNEMGSNHNRVDTSTTLKACAGNLNGDWKGKSQLLTQYSSHTTDQLGQNSEANYVITPLFEKTLSASDAGKIGRLVLPKKCAEAFLPQISHPEGLPLEVLDAKGNKWVFQFRFWPNNNSRMYVLEGITPCLQALELHAGDIVTFGRFEPEGKLVMGCRKASVSSASDKGNEAIAAGGGISAKRKNKIKEETTMKKSKRDKFDTISNRPAISGSDLITVATVEADTVNPIKRKGSTWASRRKHIRIDSGDLVQLKLTCTQAQGLLRPPPDAVPKIIIIEGFEFEEYEAAPVIGRPTFRSSDDLGVEILWVQCDDCLKWRKMRSGTLLPSRWTCSANLSDPMRSLCSAAQELMAGHLGDLPDNISNGCISKTRPTERGLNHVRPSEGLDKVVNLVIREEEGASVEITMHPPHKPSCTCITCVQSPNGKGSESKKPCNYIVSDLVNKQQLDKDAETVAMKPEHDSILNLCSAAFTCRSKPNVEIGEGLCDNSHEKETCASPTEAEIDLNSWPKREEEFTSSSSSVGVINLLASRPGQSETLADTDQAELSGRLSNFKVLEGCSQRIDLDRHVVIASNTITSTTLSELL